MPLKPSEEERFYIHALEAESLGMTSIIFRRLHGQTSVRIMAADQVTCSPAAPLLLRGQPNRRPAAILTFASRWRSASMARAVVTSPPPPPKRFHFSRTVARVRVRSQVLQAVLAVQRPHRSSEDPCRSDSTIALQG